MYIPLLVIQYIHVGNSQKLLRSFSPEFVLLMEEFSRTCSDNSGLGFGGLEFRVFIRQADVEPAKPFVDHCRTPKNSFSGPRSGYGVGHEAWLLIGLPKHSLISNVLRSPHEPTCFSERAS